MLRSSLSSSSKSSEEIGGFSKLPIGIGGVMVEDHLLRRGQVDKYSLSSFVNFLLASVTYPAAQGTSSNCHAIDLNSAFQA